MKQNVYLAQPQYSIGVGKEKNYWIPYSIGCVWSYCYQYQDIQENYQLVKLLFKRDPHEQVLSNIDNPSVVAFSCYQWNREYNLNLARLIKQQWPNVTIVFGGAEVNASFCNYTFIDSVVLAEGEYSFLDILRKLANGIPVPKIYNKSRVEELDYPSPYDAGIFDQIVREHPDAKWAVTLETNRGCPFACTFCDWGSLTYNKIRKLPIDRVQKDLDWISKNPVSYIFCADANFGIFKDRDLDIATRVAECGRRSSNLEAFNATFNKNNNEYSFEILKVLGDLNRGFTVSVQSLNLDTLKAVKRNNLGINDLRKIFNLCQKHNISSYTEVILGLPLETKQSFIDGICELLELGQHNQIEVWFANLLVNSELATVESKQAYGITSIRTNQNLALFSQDLDQWGDYVDIVNSTNTMSTEDMIESFMFAWVIVNFHLQGYTQIVSRYVRYKYNISYKEFYKNFIDHLKDNPNLSCIYNYVLKNITSFLSSGSLDNNLRGHNLISTGTFDIYLNKEEIFNELKKIISDDDVLEFQQKFILDTDQQYPCTVTCNYDIFSDAVGKNVDYQIDNKVTLDNFDDFENNFYRWRRKGLIKNKVLIRR